MNQIKELKVLHIAVEVAALQQREDSPVVFIDEVLIGRLVPVSPAILHPVFFPESLDLTVTEHRKARHRCKEGAHSKILVAVAELGDGGLLVGVVHEVHEALEDFRFIDEGVFNRIPVFFILLVFEHVHERAVVHPVHSQGSDEVALHHPERFGKQEGVRQFLIDPVDDLPPKLIGDQAVERLVIE